MTITSVSPRELGVPVKSVNWVRLHPGQRADGSPSLLATMGEDAQPFFICDIDVETSHCRQFCSNLKNAAFPTAGLRTRSGVLYVGSAYVGHLHRYDPDHPERGLEDLGAIDPELAAFPCQLDEAPDGSIFIGAYGGCSLTRFDPKTGQFHRLGRMDPTDMYFYPLCGADGTVAGTVRMCHVHVEIVNPQTGEHHRVGPIVDTQELKGGGVSADMLSLFKGADGLLYLRSKEEYFRLQGMDAIPVAKAPELAAAKTLPGGLTAEFSDSKSFQHRRVEIRRGAEVLRTLSLDWEGHGTTIFMTHAGPDGKIYGSSILPEHLFVYDPDGGHMQDLGQCSLSGGEAYSMANFQGKIYISSYPHSRLSIYDPAQPVRFGEDEQANPRDVGRIDSIGIRPRCTLAGPAGKVWLASYPDYGTWGGTLAWYDPATGAKGSHRHLIQDCSVCALAWIDEPGYILVGLTIGGGTGTQPRAKAAGFVLWDAEKDQAIGRQDFGLADIELVKELAAAGPGLALAVVVQPHPTPTEETGKFLASLVLLDLVAGTVRERSELGGEHGWPLENTFRTGPDGAIYGLTAKQLYRVRPGSAQREVIWSIGPGREPDLIHAGGAIVAGRYYFGNLHRLYAIQLPD